MKLHAYLQQHKITAAEFARRIGVVSRMSVIRYANGTRTPEPRIMVKIHEVTRGEVTPNDFVLPESKRTRQGRSQPSAEVA